MKSSKNKKEAEKRVSEIEYGKKKNKLSKQEIIPESKNKKIKREKDWVDDLSSDEMEFLVSIIQRYGGKAGGKYNGELDHDSIIMYGNADGSKVVELIKSKLSSLSDIGKSQAESILSKIKPIPKRIQDMVSGWKKEGKAFSNVNNDDSEFFITINKSPLDVAVTSQAGSDLLYYDKNLYASDTDAIKSRKKK